MLFIHCAVIGTVHEQSDASSTATFVPPFQTIKVLYRLKPSMASHDRDYFAIFPFYRIYYHGMSFYTLYYMLL